MNSLQEWIEDKLYSLSLINDDEFIACIEMTKPMKVVVSTTFTNTKPNGGTSVKINGKEW